MCLLLTSRAGEEPRWSQPLQSPAPCWIQDGSCVMLALPVPSAKSLRMSQALKVPCKPQLPYVCWKQSIKMCFGLLWPCLHSPILGTAAFQVQGDEWRTPGRFLLDSMVRAFPLTNGSHGAGRVSSHGWKATAGSACLTAVLCLAFSCSHHAYSSAAEGWDVPDL